MTDRGGLSGDGTIAVELTKTNVAPAFSNPQLSMTVDENSADGTEVGRVDATDANDGQSLTFSLAPTGPSANVPFPFVVQSLSGSQASSGADGTAVIAVAPGSGGAGPGMLNYEGAVKSYEALLTVTDSDSTTPLSTTAKVMIRVSETAEAPYFDTSQRLPNSVRFDVTIEEGAAAGTAVRMADAAEEASTGQGAPALLTAQEDDIADAGTLVYTVRAPAGAGSGSQSARACGTAVVANQTTGALVVLQEGQLDFEGNPSFRCVLVATDGRGASDTADVVIALVDSNDAPMVAEDQTLAVAEDAVGGAAVGIVSVSDPDSKQEWRSFIIMLAGDPGVDWSAAGSNTTEDSADDSSVAINDDAESFRLFQLDPSSASLVLREG